VVDRHLHTWGRAVKNGATHFSNRPHAARPQRATRTRSVGRARRRAALGGGGGGGGTATAAGGGVLSSSSSSAAAPPMPSSSPPAVAPRAAAAARAAGVFSVMVVLRMRSVPERASKT